MALDDLRDFLDQPTLTLPIGGKTYDVKPVTAKVWLELQALATDRDAQTAKRDMDLLPICLGADVLKQMIDDGVTGPELKHVGQTAFMWQLGQQDLAEALWRSGGKALTSEDPEDPPKTETPTLTAGVTTTPRRASRTTTTARPRSKPNSTAAPSPGRRS